MDANVAPPSVDSCHCTPADPDAAVVKLTEVPEVTVWLVGFNVTVGAGDGMVTVSVAALVTAVPPALVKTARYSLPLSAVAAVKVSVVDVAPEMDANVAPPSVDSCHCTPADPVAAVKLTEVPEVTVWLVGFQRDCWCRGWDGDGEARRGHSRAPGVGEDSWVSLPLSAVAAVKVSVVDVAPEMDARTSHHRRWTCATAPPQDPSAAVANYRSARGDGLAGWIQRDRWCRGWMVTVSVAALVTAVPPALVRQLGTHCRCPPWRR